MGRYCVGFHRQHNGGERERWRDRGKESCSIDLVLSLRITAVVYVCVRACARLPGGGRAWFVVITDETLLII